MHCFQTLKERSKSLLGLIDTYLIFFQALKGGEFVFMLQCLTFLINFIDSCFHNKTIEFSYKI